MSVKVDASSRRGKAVKRSLFGTVDHEQIRDDLNRELKRITDEKRRKWNFDFENFKPLRGRYKWERVGKRLQTRKSPTEITPPLGDTENGSAENVCQQRSVDSAQSTTRYNLRTRDKELDENIAGFNLKPIDPSRRRLRELGTTVTTAEYRNTGDSESKGTTKRKAKSSPKANTVQRKTKLSSHMEAKKATHRR